MATANKPAAKKSAAAKESPPSKKKPVARKTTAKSKAAARKAPAKPAQRSPVKRGPELIAAIVAKLRGPGSVVSDPRPLSPKEIADAEKRAGVALSPSMHALLSVDASYMTREFAWFRRQQLDAKPAIEVIREHAGPFVEAFEPMFAARFPEKGLPLDFGSDSMRLLYLGDPDEHGEYPVLWIDHDDTPIMGLERAGFDVWLADWLEIPVDAADADAAAKKRLFGKHDGLDAMDFMTGDPPKLPVPVRGPKPGAVKHPEVAVPPGIRQ